MRLAGYVAASVALAGGVILKALHQRPNFYSACVYLSQSNANLMILTNLCLLVVGFLVFGLQRLLYGRLRAIETEQLYEKAWFAVTETCLAMTIFRGEMGGWFLVMFVCLLVGKLWGWIAQGRLEVLEQQPPSNPRLFHARLAISLLLSVAFDAFLLKYCVKTVLRQARPDMMVMFGFEFAILTILSLSTAARYIISLVELYIVWQQKRIKLAERRQQISAARADAAGQQDGMQTSSAAYDDEEIDEMELDVPGWEEKARWVFYLDLITDFFKLVVYLCFFAILFTFYGLPIHILRDVILTMKSFVKRILHFVRYRNATRDMNQRYPDATAEEISREDVCIICREEMYPWRQPVAANGQAPRIVSERLRPKKLPCGHLLHFGCLRSWLERQQNCPTCRRPVAFVGGADQENAQAGAAPDRRGPGPQEIPGINQPGGANAQGPAEGRPRAWFLNLGPVRIGFGAGRGDFVQNLVQQMQNNGQPPRAAPAPNPNPPPADATQQLGFGFGFGRRPANTQFNHQNVQLQILQLEQQIVQEINSLMATAEQLNVVRLLQGELARLRNTQPNQNQGQTQGQPTTTAAPPTNIATPAQAQATTTTAHPSTTTAAPASANSAPHTGIWNQRQWTNMPQRFLHAGDPRLPEGLMLPPGWTLQPLQRVPLAGQRTGSQFEHASSSADGVNQPSESQSAPSSLNSPSSVQLFPSSPYSSSTGRGPNATAQDSHASSTDSTFNKGNTQNTSKPTSSAALSRVESRGILDEHSDIDGENSKSTFVADTEPCTSSNEPLQRRPGNSCETQEQGSSSSSGKGKARAATVEDADEE
ncbi:hypothetical protein VTO42DRAFT_5245 [Malbranchea cinnamomea]